MQNFRMGASGACRWGRTARFLALSLALLPAVALGASDGRPPQDAAILLAPGANAFCLAGCPQGAPADNRVIERRDFTLSNNGRTKFADWVAYAVAAAGFGPSRKRIWRADPSLPEAETLEPEDYRGAHAAIGTDRGHQVPLASFAGARDWRMTNYLSNVTPQKSALNRGPWAQLERAIRRLATSSRVNAIHVVTGPLYEREMPGLPNADEPHSVPSGYWKVVAIRGPDGLEAIGFAMDQDLARSADFCAAPRKIDIPSLERRIGLRLFPALDPPAFRLLVASANSMARRLGCEN